MPLLTIDTNQHLDESERPAFLRAASETVADMLGKSEQYVMVRLHEGVAMSFAGSQEPTAILQLKSLGLPEDRTGDYSIRLCDLIAEYLMVPPERIYIEFSSPPRHMWGWNRRTF